MPYVIVAHNGQSSSGTSVPDAAGALAIISSLAAEGFLISAVINERGVAVETAELERLEQAETAQSTFD